MKREMENKKEITNQESYIRTFFKRNHNLKITRGIKL